MVIDFSAFAPGTVLYIGNPTAHDTVLPNPMFCYRCVQTRFRVHKQACCILQLSAADLRFRDNTLCSSPGAQVWNKRSIQQVKFRGTAVLVLIIYCCLLACLQLYASCPLLQMNWLTCPLLWAVERSRAIGHLVSKLSCVSTPCTPRIVH